MNSYSLNRKVMSLEEKVKIIREFELIPDIQKRNNLRKSDPIVDSIVLNRRKILRQYAIMQTKLAAVKTVAAGFGGTKYKAEKQSLLERVVSEWYQRVNVFLKPIKISEPMFQETVKMTMHILNIATLPLSFSCENFFKRCCYLANRNDMKTSKTTNLKAIIKELIIADGISKEYALNIFGIDITVDEEDPKVSKETNTKQEERSLKDKVNIITSYGLLNKDQQASLKRRNAQISGIIENKAKILLQYKAMNARLALVRGQIISDNVTKKFSLLLKIMVEWYLRADENPGAKGATISMIELREKTYTAFKMFGFTTVPASVHWLNSQWKSCQAAKNKAAPGKSLLSLGLKDIARYVLEREGVSKKLAQTYFGIDIPDEHEESACKVARLDNQQHASNLNSDWKEASDLKTKGSDDFDAATCSTASMQQSNLNECTTEDEEETFELFDVISTGSSVDFDGTTSTEYINYNDLIKEEFDIADDIIREDISVSSTNACTAIKVYDDDSQTARDLSADTFIRPSVQDWLMQNEYEIAADLQQEKSTRVKHEASSISSLQPSDEIKIVYEDSLNIECDAVKEDMDRVPNLRNDEDKVLTFMTEDLIKNGVIDTSSCALSPYTVITVKENRTAEDCLETTAATSIRESVQNWLKNNECESTDDIQQIVVKVEDSLGNECAAVEETIDHISNLDNEDDESIEMIIFIDEMQQQQ